MPSSVVNARREWLACTMSPYYFVHNYCYIYDAVAAVWVPFALWPGQVSVLKDLDENRLLIILKARQLGQTWLVLCYILWLMIFQPARTMLLFSRRDDEAQYLLERLRGIYSRLPVYMQAKRIVTSNNHEWRLSNGSIAYAFPTTAGDSYTASMAFVDEADLVENLDFLMNAVKPTIDNGGRMVLLSRSNKDLPESSFKRMYRAAKAGESSWKAVFLPWFAHPQRDQEWYEEQVRDSIARTASIDDVWQQYPADDLQALAPRTMDKRIPAPWANQCFRKIQPILKSKLHSINPKLEVYHEPNIFRSYVIGADPAEGNPTSDFSAFHVLDAASGEEVCHFSERMEPSLFAILIAAVARAYNDAGVLVERNNHGHVVIAALNEMGDINLLAGLDQVAGWHTNSKSKAEMYSTAADAFKDMTTMLHTEKTYFQLVSIEGATLKAPEDQFDDEAVSYALALQAISAPPATVLVWSYIPKSDDMKITARNSRRYREAFRDLGAQL